MNIKVKKEVEKSFKPVVLTITIDSHKDYETLLKFRHEIKRWVSTSDIPVSGYGLTTAQDKEFSQFVMTILDNV